MFRFAALLTLVSAAAFAAPVPTASDKERLELHWGKFEGVGEYSLAGQQLTLRTGKAPTRGLSQPTQTDMPRTARKVDGDFTASVRILDAALPARPTDTDRVTPSSNSGLFIQGGGFGVELSLWQDFVPVKGKPALEVRRQLLAGAYAPNSVTVSILAKPEDGKSTLLRATRKGKAVSVSYSFDGTKWSAPRALTRDVDFPAQVTIGVFVSHTSQQPVHATFDVFTVEKPKVEK
jgi:hypothetical protein